MFLSDPWLRRSGPSKIDSSKWVVSSPHCIDASFVIECYGVPYHRIVTSWFVFCSAAVLLTCWGGVHQFFTMDTILRLLEGLRRDELVWLNTYLTGRLRALPPPATATTPVQLPSTPPCTDAANDPGGEQPAAALAERVGDFNLSMDPWERTGAAPQGVGITPAPVGAACPRIYSATTSGPYSSLLWWVLCCACWNWVELGERHHL